MPRINLQSLDRLESNELRNRKRTSELRAIRRAHHRTPIARPVVSAFACTECGGDCKTLMVAMQASLKAGR